MRIARREDRAHQHKRVITEAATVGAGCPGDQRLLCPNPASG